MDHQLHPIPEKTPRWALVVVWAVVILGRLAFVRGPDHHHGDDVGALGDPVAALAAGGLS